MAIKLLDSQCVSIPNILVISSSFWQVCLFYDSFSPTFSVFCKKRKETKGMEGENALLRSTSISTEIVNKKLDSRATVKWDVFWPK